MIGQDDPPVLELMASFVCQDSPINKLLYARDIPRYKQMVERCVDLNVATATVAFWKHFPLVVQKCLKRLSFSPWGFV